MSNDSDLPPGWRVAEGHHLEKEFRFPDFAQALAFVNAIGAVAEVLGHHPDLELGWGRVRVTTRTHDASAITEKDYALAARIEALPR
jgi:4a-hydroxytetrahydrobiopterin dehydratase